MSVSDFVSSSKGLETEADDTALAAQFAFILQTVPSRAHTQALTLDEYVASHATKMAAVPDAAFPQLIAQLRKSLHDIHLKLAPLRRSAAAAAAATATAAAAPASAAASASASAPSASPYPQFGCKANAKSA